MRRTLMPCLALLATTMTTEARAQDAGAPRFFARAGSAAPFSPAVQAGDTVYLSGQIGVEADGTIPPTMAGAAKAAMENMRAALTLAGLGFDDIVKCGVMLTDMDQWKEFNAVYVTYFKPGRLPARSAWGASDLALGASVEIECIAYRAKGQP